MHFDADAALVDWEPKMFTFTLDSFITVTYHIERVVVKIVLCGYTKVNNNWFVQVFLNIAVILIYCLRWATTQSSLSLNVLSSIGGKWWPGLVVFKVSGTNKTRNLHAVQIQTLNSLVSLTCCEPQKYC